MLAQKMDWVGFVLLLDEVLIQRACTTRKWLLMKKRRDVECDISQETGRNAFVVGEGCRQPTFPPFFHSSHLDERRKRWSQNHMHTFDKPSCSGSYKNLLPSWDLEEGALHKKKITVVRRTPHVSDLPHIS
jgi:hypothetical protein